MRTAIWWIRRDLRLNDNNALRAALEQAEKVIPLFVLDPKLLRSPYVGQKRLAFLLAGLRHMEADLNAHGSTLIIRKGDPLDILRAVISETQAGAIFAEGDFSPYARERDDQIAGELPLRIVEGLTVWPPSTITKADGNPYSVFTPFSRAWRALPILETSDVHQSPRNITTPLGLASDHLPITPILPPEVPFPPGEREAQHRLDVFTKGRQAPIYRYAEDRNQLDISGSSRLSPYLRFGMLSTRQAVNAAYRAIDAAPDKDARESAQTWLTELIWREFYINILHHYPNVRTQSFRSNLRAIPWKNNESDFTAWCEGQTGFPVVDAAMRQLSQTGWMHNRGRMIVASFLVKDLLIDWRWGERWFMQHLVDGDPASNNGGWQWTAGTGTDAAPYFRIFNPILQSKKFDPHGKFIHNWVPELKNLTGKYVHEPWKMSSEMQEKTGCVLGVDYPAPIVDHATARKRALEAYAFSRESSGSKE
ncbi:MAG: cryptochrome/photolyase family protein [Candidatus Hodarchaeota archaeon]